MFALRPTPVLVARRCCRSSARLARSFATSPALTASAAPSSTRCRALVYTQHGEPSQIIEGHSYDLPAPKPDQALLRMGLGSVNPADLNVLEGKYPSRPQKRDDIGFREPAYIGGNEGFAVIQHIPQGSKVAKDMGLKEGDWVVFGRPQMGTWRSHLIADVKDLIKVPRSKEGALTEVMASTLMINPATALCMMRDFETLKEGDVVIQNAANSAVGQAAIQIAARKLGLETVNLVRDRHDMDSLRKQLTDLGRGGLGTHVMTYNELADRNSGARERVKEILKGRQIRLGLNALCGKDTVSMAKLMGSPSTLVTYGAMSKSPLTLPASMQIFSDISAKGFWMTRWYAQHGREDREKLMAELAAWYEDGSLTPPAHEIVTLGEASQSDSDMAQRAREAISRAQAGFGGKKTFLRFGAGLSAGQSAASQAFLGQRQAQRTFTTWTPQIRKRENVSSAAREISSSSIAQAQVNPGPPPPVEKIGVDAVLRQNPNSPDTHTTTIFSEFSLEGKTAVISGGNGGLGLEMALAYVEAGANVYAIDLPKEPSEEFKIVAEHCKIMDRKLQYISASVTDDADITAAMKHIVKESGRLDICVAAAGILQTYQALDYPVEEFEKVFSVNTTGVFLTARAAAREMHAQPDIHGSIILIASMSGSIVNRDHSWVAYNASKSAVLQMGRNLAAEWGPKDIRVNTISPGHIRTRMTAAYLDQNPHLLKKWSDSNPLGRIGRTHEIRGAAVWLASPASTFCNGSDIVVSGGHQIW